MPKYHNHTPVKYRHYSTVYICAAINLLSRPIYIVRTVPNIIMAQFIYVKILEWNVSKSASLLLLQFLYIKIFIS